MIELSPASARATSAPGASADRGSAARHLEPALEAESVLSGPPDGPSSAHRSAIDADEPDRPAGRPRLVLRLHRWAGLATAGFLIVIGLTGAVLAFQHELEAVVSPELFTATPPPGRAATDFLDPLAVRARVERAFPHARVDHLSFPVPGQSQMFYLTPRRDPATGQPFPLAHDQAFANPYTGEVLGARLWGQLFADGFRRENLVPFIWRVHEALALPHPWGKLFIGLVSVIWLVDCFVGLALTFPRARPVLRKWRAAWLIKRKASRARRIFDIHRAGALWSWAGLLFFAFSGMMLNTYDVVYQPLMSLAFTFEPDRPARVPQAELTPVLDWHAAHERGRAALQAMAANDGFTIEAEDSLWYRPAFGAYMYRTRTSLDIRDTGGRSDLWIDGTTGVVRMARFDGRAASGDAISAWLRTLHTAQFGGVAYRILVSLVGVLVAVLSITGVLIWLRKARKRRRTITGSGNRGLMTHDDA